MMQPQQHGCREQAPSARNNPAPETLPDDDQIRPDATEAEADRRLQEERHMSMRFLTTTAVIVLISGPALADCAQEIKSLKEAVTQTETGASSAKTGLPATKHQEQVLAGNQQGDKSTAGAGAAGQADVPESPHQQQALAEPAAGGNAASGQQAADLVAQASDMAEAGNEEGCMQKVAEAKDLLGID
jgi:hypothetical protein